jgi:hypothetical protein
MSEHGGPNSLIKGHPITIFFVAVVFLVFIAWMASSVAPGGASHFHTVACDSSNPGPGFPSCPGNDTNTSYYDLAGGTTDNFGNFYNEFTVIFGGILIMIVLLGGLAMWMLRSRGPHE